MNSNRKSHKDQALAPSRTLFVRNVQFDVQEKDILKRFEPFGDIKTTFNLISKRGLLFVTYYDVRAAENAMASLNDLEFNGRRADLHYSVPKQGDSPEKAQASVMVNYSGSPDMLVTHVLFQFMSKFGEVKNIRDGPESSIKIVSFWDTRAAARAIEGLEEDGNFNGGVLKGKLYWDEGFEQFANSDPEKRPRSRSRSPVRGDQRRDNNNRKYDRNRDRDNNRDRGRRDNQPQGGLNLNNLGNMPQTNPQLAQAQLLALLLQLNNQQQIQQQPTQLPPQINQQQLASQLTQLAQLQQIQLAQQLSQNNPQLQQMSNLNQFNSQPQLAQLSQAQLGQQPLGSMAGFPQFQAPQLTIPQAQSSPANSPQISQMNHQSQTQVSRDPRVSQQQLSNSSRPAPTPTPVDPRQQNKPNLPNASNQLEALAALLMQNKK